MQSTSPPPAPYAGSGLMLAFANGPFGRALVGVGLGLALFAAYQAGWLRQADLSALDRMSALVHRPWESAPIVVVAAPVQVADARTHRAALANVLEAGAAVVGFDETYLHPRGRTSAEEAEALLRLAADSRCVIAEAVPGGMTGISAARPRLAAVEEFSYEAGRAREVARRGLGEGRQSPVGFAWQVAVKALAGYAHSPEVRRSIEHSLDLLDSPGGMLLDYSIRPAPVHLTTLESMATGPTVGLRERVLGRVVLLSAASWDAAAGRGPSGALSGARATEPAVAWAIATALSGSGAAEAHPELVGSGLVVLGLLLMLIMGDRGLRGKLIAGAVACVGLTGLSLGSLMWWKTLVPPCSFALGIVAAFLIAACLELAEAGSLIAQEARAEPDASAWGQPRRVPDPAAAVEETLRSILGWRPLPGVALLLRDSARPAGLVVLSADGVADWSGQPALQALGEEALAARTPVVGDWPGGEAKALAIPVIVESARGAALILATPQLPAQPDVVEFGRRAVRHLLTTRAPRSRLGVTLRDPIGRPHRLPLSAQVARLRASRLARQQQTALTAAWRAGPHEAVIVFGADGKPVLWNRRAETLFDGEKNVDLAQKHIVSLLAETLETNEAEVRDVALGVLLHGAPYICDLEDPTGRYNYVASLTRIGADGEAPAGLALRCVDVTGICRPARVEARLMSVAAHEMRTPLTSVMGYAELLQNHAEEGSSTRRYAEAIRRQAERMEAVVAELLTVTRLEAGREDLVVEPVDMAALARQVAAEMQPLADARHVVLTVQAVGEVGIRGDVPKLERVVQNLVSNAIKYSAEGASVSIRLRRDGGRVALGVQDTGYGISAEDAPHVFEKFYRAKNQHTESVEGTGLGLAIVRLIAEAHGGTVSLRTVEGAGSTFTVAFPVDGPPEKRVSDPAA